MPYTGIPLTLEKKASGEESEVSQPVSLTYLNRWKAFSQVKIIILVIIITIMKKKRETIVKYQWYFDLGGITFNSHFKTAGCLSTVKRTGNCISIFPYTYLCFAIESPAVPLYPPIKSRYLSEASATLKVEYSAKVTFPSKSSRSTLSVKLPAAAMR